MMPKRSVLAGFCRAAVCVVAVMISLVLPMLARGEASVDDRVDKAVEQLVAEAKELGLLKGVEHRAVFTRPHRAVRALQLEDGEAVALRLADKFTGDLYGDTYVRWHLLPAVEDWLKARAASPHAGSSEPLPAGVGRALRSLMDDLPGESKSRYENPYSKEGRRIGSQIARLRAQTRVKVGIPPFEKTYSGRAALPHMTPPARRAAEKIVKQIEALEAKRKRMRDPDQEKRNERNKQVDKAIREYRGDLAYALIQTGEARSLNTVGSAIGVLIRKRQRAGLDLMGSTYLAMHDGYLGRFSDKDLSSFRARLNKAASGARGYEVYYRGDEPLPNYIKPNKRSFGIYASHMLDLLQDPAGVRQFSLPTESKQADRTNPPVGPFDPDTLSIEDIRAAIGAATEELYSARSQRKKTDIDAVLPHEGVRHDSELYSLYRYRQGTPRYQEVTHEAGNHALVCWAMLAAGESYQDPRLYRRISWVLSSDMPYTYDRGMRLMMLSRLSLDRFGPSAKRDAGWLGSAVTDRGNFNGEYFGGPSTGWGEHGSGLYGVLGLWGASRMGVDQPEKKVWTPIDKHWRLTQQKTPGDQAAGWAVGMFNTRGDTHDANAAANDARRKRTGAGYTQVNGPMTAGGIATLTLTERYLRGPSLTDPGKDNVSPELRKGLRWLDENFDPDQSPGADWFYTMWTVQRVGQATGRRTFNGVDWFRHITAEMLNRQRDDGLWEDPSGKQGKLLSSGFALLYLANALNPVAVAKVKFDGRWDNRPNDLWNFIEYASDKYEVDTAWQIVSLDQPMHELADAPMLYLATNKSFALGEAEVDRLRDYIDAGGMLLFNPEGPYTRVAGSVDALIEALFPGRSLEPVAEFHPFYSLHTKLRPTVKMRMVHNGVRPLVVVFDKDIGRGLQANDPDRRPDSFVAMSNIYLFTVGTEPRRVRISTSYVAPPDIWPTEKIKAARVRYAGDSDPEPGSLPQLRAAMARDHGVDLVVERLDATELSDQRIAFLTTAGEGGLTDDQAAALRAWVDAGGTLWLDAAGGSSKAVRSANAMLIKLFPNRAPTPLADDSPIITGQGLAFDGHDARRVSYSRFAQRQMGPSHEPRLQAVTIDGRPAVIYSSEDLTAALAGVGHWGVFGYSTDSARKLVANGVLTAAR